MLESAENGNTGGSLNSTAGVFRLGDDAANRQYRAILSFNTAALPDNARLQSVQLKIRPNGAPVGASPFQSLGRLVFDLRSGWFGVNGALAAADFNTTASLMSAGTFSSSLSAGWYTASLSSSTALGSINRAGVTQLRLRFTKDDNNNRAANYMNFFSGNAAAGQPVLVITYTLP